jgi:cyclopropane fatty-acyl-phospholipid synthase-like methyltransferase
MNCPLCKSSDLRFFYKGEGREYHHCKICDLVSVADSFLVTSKEEKAKYDNHKNTPLDLGYCNFLDRLLIPLKKELKPSDKGLDFGSGPGPTLSKLMKDRGFDMDIYDIFYHDDRSVFENSYDFITSTEVFEHLKEPLFEIERLWSCLKSGGVLGVMTAFRVEDFDNWYYKRDLTHIRFFTKKSFEWLAHHLGAKMILCDGGVVILKKEDRDE